MRFSTLTIRHSNRQDSDTILTSMMFEPHFTKILIVCMKQNVRNVVQYIRASMRYNRKKNECHTQQLMYGNNFRKIE